MLGRLPVAAIDLGQKGIFAQLRVLRTNHLATVGDAEAAVCVCVCVRVVIVVAVLRARARVCVLLLLFAVYCLFRSFIRLLACSFVLGVQGI